MASGDLFRAFTVRFSFKKEQHVRMLQKFENKELDDGKSKNQIIMDALESNSDTKEDKLVKKQLLEQRLEQFWQECKGEILRELLRIFVSSRMAGQPVMAVSSIGEPTAEEIMEDEVAAISGMPDVMDKIMRWSDS